MPRVHRVKLKDAQRTDGRENLEEKRWSIGEIAVVATSRRCGRYEDWMADVQISECNWNRDKRR
jgi:hypothetical protein